MFAVTVRVIAPVPFECKFWIASDGWHAVADGMDIAVHARAFEETKRNMEAALNEYVQALLPKPYIVSRTTAA